MIETKSVEVNCKGADVLPIDRIIEFQGKLKKLSEKNRERLKASILKHGFISPFFVWDDAGEYKLLDGHQRLATLLYMREKEGYDMPLFPVVYVHAETVEDAKRKLLQITSQYGEFTTDGFAEFTAGLDLDADEFRIVDGEFDLDFLKDEQETTGDDEVPEVEEEVYSKLGEIYELGPHRLMCGDSTSIDAVEKLMGGQKADMVFTDPPYGMSYEGGRSNKNFGMIKNDDAEGSDLVDLVRDAIATAKANSKEGSSFYVCFPWRTYAEFEAALQSCAIEINSCIVWDKKSIGLGHQDYRPQHEFIFYSKGGQFYGDRSQSDVWYMSRGNTGAYVHPTQKPVELIEKALNNSSKSGDVVIDCFDGSGSTLIACEKTGRHARLMELDPKYCDVIRRRWTKWASENGKEVGSGKLI